MNLILVSMLISTIKKPNGKILNTKVYVKKLIQFDKLAAGYKCAVISY